MFLCIVCLHDCNSNFRAIDFCIFCSRIIRFMNYPHSSLLALLLWRRNGPLSFTRQHICRLQIIYTNRSKKAPVFHSHEFSRIRGAQSVVAYLQRTPKMLFRLLLLPHFSSIQLMYIINSQLNYICLDSKLWFFMNGSSIWHLGHILQRTLSINLIL